VTEIPFVSIVITSYTTDRLEDILSLLGSIKAQTYPKIETIFVAERSRELYDQLEAYAREDGILPQKVIFNDGEKGLSAARNLGIKEAKGDVIAFVDDDTLLPPNWVDEMVKTYKDDFVIGVTGPSLPLWEDESAASWFPEEFYWIIGCTAWSGWDGIRVVRNAWGQGMSFRKEAFQLAGTFLADIGFQMGNYRQGLLTLDVGDDVELSLRVRARTGKSIVFNPEVKLWHRVHSHRLSWRFVARRSYWIGRSRRILKQLYSQSEASTTALLSQEHQLLKRIFVRLFPSIVKTFFRSPLASWRRILVSVTALFFVTLGYYSHSLSFISPGTKIARRPK
jgi:GT2 family glycosyltransferase